MKKFEFVFEFVNIFLRFLHISEEDDKIESKKWRNSNDRGRINWKTRSDSKDEI